jgi:hypothetical protein
MNQKDCPHWTLLAYGTCSFDKNERGEAEETPYADDALVSSRYQICTDFLWHQIEAIVISQKFRPFHASFALLQKLKG